VPKCLDTQTIKALKRAHRHTQHNQELIKQNVMQHTSLIQENICINVH